MAVKQEFVFVNKTKKSSTLSRSYGQERSLIFSKAQQQRGQPNSPENFVIVTATAFSGKELSITSRSRTRPVPKEHRLPVKELAPSEFDPFQSFPIYLNNDMQSMLAYYYHTVLPAIWPRGMLATARQDLTDYALRDAAVLYAILGLSNAVILSAGQDETHTRHVNRFRYLTVKEIRKSLHSHGRVDATTAHAIALLLRLECGQGDVEAAKIHFDGLVKMLASIAFEQIPYTLLSSIQASLDHCSIMLERNSPALLPTSTDEDDLSSVPFHLGTLLATTPLRLSSQPYRALVGDALLGIATKWHVQNSYKESADREGIQLSYEQLRTLHIARFSLEHQLLSLTFPDSLNEPYNSARNVIRVALCIVCGPPINISLPQKPYQTSLSRQMHTALQRSVVGNQWTVCPDLLLWVLVIAGYVSYQQDEWPWIVLHAAAICRQLQIHDLAALQKVLFQFDIVPERFTNISRILWEDVQIDLMT